MAGFRLTVEHHPGGDFTVYAFDGAKRIGHLKIFRVHAHPEYGVIRYVKVEDGYTRQGVATRMLCEARNLIPDIRHSRDRTDAGDAWAHAVGGAILEPFPIHREKAAA